jgi:hypothetical protein
MTIPRGARHQARVRAANLYSVDLRGSDHDAVMRIGSEAPRRRAHSKPRLKDHSAISGCHHLGSSFAAQPYIEAELQDALLGLHLCQTAGRSRRPADASPVVTSRHSAMRSLRASATIMVLCAPPRASAVRRRYHSDNELSL